MKRVRIELKWEWKLEGSWSATVITVMLLVLLGTNQVIWPGLI